MGRNRVYHFEEEGVTAYLHYQVPALVVKGIEAIERDTPKNSEFHPNRLIMNVVLADAVNTNNYKKIFFGQLILHVRFNPGDVAYAKTKGSEPVLLYWDGTTWVRFTVDEHEFTLYYDQGMNDQGVGVVKIRHWGDPEIAWGP